MPDPTNTSLLANAREATGSLLSSHKATDHTDPAAKVYQKPDSSRGDRETSFEVSDFPIPHGREEDWRFTPVDRLVGFFADEPGAGADATYDVRAPQAVTVSTLAAGEAPRGTGLRPADRAAAVASKYCKDALYVSIPAEAELDEPVRITVTGPGTGNHSNMHFVLQAGHHSKGMVIIEHVGGGDLNGNVETIVDDAANLTVVSLQRWDDGANHLGQHDALIRRDASYRHIAVSLGGSIVRINTNVRYEGAGGEATLLGVYFADAGQHLEHRSFVDHNTPHCTSRVTYKGALQGENAHTVWVGDVLIRAEAEGVDTYEQNRNLVLTDGAHADSVPNLEIETGEIVGAGHASSTGRFDDEQLFYLRARGIPEKDARRLVVRGFFADVVHKIGLPEVVDPLMDAIDVELTEAGE